MLTYIFTVLSLFLAQSSAESQVSLTAEPGVISERLTDSVTLTCSLQDVFASEDLEASRHPSTSYDIEHVSSIIILRKGSANAETPVARIIGSNSAEAVTDEGNLQVTGYLNPDKPSNSQFLKLVWTKPGQQQAGQYTCEVHALDMLGRGVVLKANADVRRKVPGNEELIAEIVSLKNKTSTLEQTLKPPHTEQGVVSCSSADSWHRVGSDNLRAVYKTVQFKKPYVDVSVVVVGFIYVDVDKNRNTRYRIDISNVSRTGFKVACQTWNNSVVYGLHARWTSIVA